MVAAFKTAFTDFKASLDKKVSDLTTLTEATAAGSLKAKMTASEGALNTVKTNIVTSATVGSKCPVADYTGLKEKLDLY